MSQVVKYNFKPEQIAKLLSMQDELNTYIHPEWKTQGFNWDLAIIDECMEIHDHLGWKWWKKDYQVGMTEQNRKQIQLEVIDILHFAVSQTVEFGCTGIMINQPCDLHNIWVAEATNFALESVVAKDFDLHQWAVLAHSVHLTEQEILETYAQKYVLNKFRQDHGYKTGEYVKVWELNDQYGGLRLEDNEVLERVVRTIKQEAQDTTDETILYNELEQAYNSRLNK